MVERAYMADYLAYKRPFKYNNCTLVLYLILKTSKENKKLDFLYFAIYEKGWSSSLGVGRDANHPSLLKLMFRNTHRRDDSSGDKTIRR